MPFAQRTQLPELPDGVYEARTGDTRFVTTRFMVYTVQTGQLAGQRIIKSENRGTWKGFANIRLHERGLNQTTDDFEGLYVWRSQRNNVDGAYVVRVSTAIQTFIARVRGLPETEFVMFEDVPILPAALRSRLNPVLEPEPVIIPPFYNTNYRNRPRTIVDRPLRAPGHRVVAVEDLMSNGRRTVPLAMSFFNSDVVR